jgi:hypothetical protein
LIVRNNLKQEVEYSSELLGPLLLKLLRKIEADPIIKSSYDISFFFGNSLHKSLDASVLYSIMADHFQVFENNLQDLLRRFDFSLSCKYSNEFDTPFRSLVLNELDMLLLQLIQDGLYQTIKLRCQLCVVCLQMNQSCHLFQSGT